MHGSDRHDSGGDRHDSGGVELLAKLRGLGRATRIEALGVIDLDFDAGHPQGLARHGGLYWLTTVDMERLRGLVLAFDEDGELVHRVDVTDGDRFHPGGCDVSGSQLIVPVAEYRPDSSAVVCALDLDDLTTTVRFGLDDHLGAVVELPGGGYVAGTWGSRDLIRVDADGAVVERRANSSHFVDFQDSQVLDADTIVCTGVADILTPVGLTQIGGIALLDVDTLALTSEVPVTTYSPTGRVITYNSVCFLATDEEAHMVTVPDDGRSQAGIHRLG